MSQAQNNDHRTLLDHAAAVLREIGGQPADLGGQAQGRAPRSSAFESPETREKRSWPALERLAGTRDWGRPQVGDMPPSPPTLRGRIGAVLVRIVQRALLWYSTQIVSFHRLVASAADEQITALRQLASEVEASRAEMAAIRGRIERVSEETNQQDEVIGHMRVEFQSQVESLRIRLQDGLERQMQAHAEQCAGGPQSELSEQLQETRTEVARLERMVHELKTASLQQSVRITAMVKEMRGRSVVPRDALANVPTRSIDGLVLEHANVFRGGTAEIKERLRVYVPRVRQVYASTRGAPVLDVGCGRGEWLDLMREERIEALGVDASEEMVAHCLASGLSAARTGMLAFLRGLPDESRSAITGFHVVEHLSLDDLLELLVQTVRVLRPGGMAIFETPNARNFLVATYNFYMDPTHVRPLPSELLAFLAESCGLCEVETLQLHPFPDSFRLPEDNCAAAKLINSYFYGPQDYAIIGRRA